MQPTILFPALLLLGICIFGLLAAFVGLCERV